MDILQKVEKLIYKSQKRVAQERMSIYFLILFSEAIILLYIGILGISIHILMAGLLLFIVISLLFFEIWRYAQAPLIYALNQNWYIILLRISCVVGLNIIHDPSLD